MKKILSMSFVFVMLCYVTVYATEKFKDTLNNAKKGDVEAQVKAGIVYQEKRDYKNAIKWYIKSAESGNSQALHKLIELESELNAMRYIKGIRNISFATTNSGQGYHYSDVYAYLLKNVARTSDYDTFKELAKQLSSAGFLFTFPKIRFDYSDSGDNQAQYYIGKFLYEDKDSHSWNNNYKDIGKNNIEDSAQFGNVQAKEFLLKIEKQEKLEEAEEEAKNKAYIEQEERKATNRGGKKFASGTWRTAEELNNIPVRTFVSEDNYQTIVNYIKLDRIKNMSDVSMVFNSESVSLGFRDWLTDKGTYIEIIYERRALSGNKILKRDYYRASKSDVAYWNKINKLFAK
ncbi:MAG: hypothetical protein FWG57_00605 [Endomicrobia bacterium]|nr:hypothetical protein [Endomicrobiia bacterium]